MALIINTNVEALIGENDISQNQSMLDSATTDLSSGLRINTAADDASGFAISEDLTAQVDGLNQAESNVQNGVSLVQTADGAVNDVEAMLQRIFSLADEFNGGIETTSTDQNAIISEISALASEIQQIGTEAQFNGITLFAGETVTFQVGANDGEQISVTISSLNTIVSGLAGIVSATVSGSGSTTLTSSDILSTLQSYIDSAANIGADIGAVQNRLTFTLDNLQTYSENLSSAQGTIADVDMASEMAEFSKDQILTQSSESMFASSLTQMQSVLQIENKVLQ
jgi:flagellin